MAKPKSKIKELTEKGELEFAVAFNWWWRWDAPLEGCE